MPDLTYDFPAADAVARACDAAKTSISLQTPSRGALVLLGSTDFAGRFAETFRANAAIAVEDSRELSTKLGEIAQGIRRLSDAAREENMRRRAARAWRDRVVARRADAVDSMWDHVFGEEPPPSSGKLDAPTFPDTSYAPRARSTPSPGAGPGSGGGVSSARPESLRSFASGSASLDGDLSALPGRIESAMASFARTCDFGTVDVAPVVRGFRAWLDANGGDVRWANTVAAAFESAGAGGAVVSVADSSLAAALQAAGVNRTRTDLDFGEPTLFGAVPTSGFAADPVNTATGNFIEVEHDLAFAGGATALDLSRTYNSFDTVGGAFGPGWSSVLDMRLELLDDHIAMVTDDGRRITFPTRGSSGVRAVGENLWLATEPAAVSGAASSTPPDGTVLVVRDNAGAWWSFAMTGAWLASGTGDRAAVTAGRDRDGRLVRLEHRRGRAVAFAHADGLVRSARSSDGRTVTYEYDADGMLATATSPSGTRSYTWDQDRRIERVTAADGVVECVNTYDEHGRVLRQATPHGRTLRFAYLPGRVTSVSDEDGANANTWMSDRHGRVVGIVDADGHRQSLSHDEHGNLVASTARDGSVTVHAYDDQGRLVKTVAADGTDTTVSYDEQDRVRRIERDGRLVTFEHAGPSARFPSVVADERGAAFALTWDDDLLVRMEDPAGVVVAYEYDRAGDLVAVRDALGGTIQIDRDPAGRVAATTTPLGHRTRFTYDDAGRVTSREDPAGAVWTFERDAGGRIGAVVDPLGGRTTHEHGPSGDVTSTTDPLGRTTELRYDRLGNLSAVVLPDGARWDLLHDALSRLQEVSDPAGGRWLREQDVVGRPTARVDPSGVRSVVELVDGGPSVDGSPSAPSFEFDLANRVVAGTSPLGDRTAIEYDACGRLAAWTDVDGGRTTLRYDADSRLVERVEPSGAVTVFEYDACGRLVREHVPGVGTTRYGHDLAGRLTWIDDPRNGRRTIARDAAGQMVAVDDGLGRTTAFDHDAVGQVTQTTAPSGERTRTDHTPLGQVSSTTDPLDRTVVSTRDPAGRLSTRTDPDGRTTTWVRDAAGRLSEVRHDDRLVASIARDADERSVTINDLTHPDGTPTVHRLEYGARGELLRRTTTRAGRSTTTRWEYDAAGNQRAVISPDGVRTEFDRGRGGVLTAIRRSDFPEATFRHDEDGRLTGALAGALAQAWEYEDGFLVSHSSDGSETVLERDDRGRLTAVRAPDGEAVRYEYDTASQLLAAREGSSVSTWSYDGSGRLVDEQRAAERYSYSHDGAGALLQAERHGDAPSVVQFAYDGLGRRVRAESDEFTMSYAWDELGHLRTVVREDGTDSDRTDLWVNALGELAEVNGTALSWDLTTPVATLLSVGDVPVITAPGLLGVDGTWKPSGWRRARSTQRADPWTATDAVTTAGLPDGIGVSPTGTVVVGGLEVTGARMYDPSVRSFLSPDPLPAVVGAAWSDNPYSYAGNDPVNQIDPSGLRPITDAELAAYGAGRQGLLGIAHRFSNNGAFAMDGDVHASHALSWLLGMSLLDPSPGPGFLLGLLSPMPLIGIPIGMAADFYAGTVLTSGQGEMLFGWATGTSPRTLLYGSDSKMTQAVREQLPADQRKNIIRDLKAGEPVASGYGYNAESPGLDNPNFVRDLVTVATWPIAPEENRTLLALGSYEVEARVVSRDADGPAVVEYTATNETTLGSFLRGLPGFSYEDLNRMAGDHGPMSRVTERFTWKEEVQ
ncbi:type IV secretion protein Rhs [Curtobacterium sp. MCPF17_047]|nr:type IV secretion protein Rhs [Curtobacterium sp. MCPF17_001]PZF68298.1 type IV secretion protein Rhs [Curtobacterium sp. MCPF17_047]